MVKGAKRNYDPKKLAAKMDTIWIDAFKPMIRELNLQIQRGITTSTDIDGKSFKPVIEGKESWENRTVFWNSRKARPHSTGDIKASAVRSGDYKLMYFPEKKKKELYNLKKDISEENDISSQEPQKTKELMDKLKDWKKEQLVEDNLRRRWQKAD